ncbi:DUF397 domain-containing protein [Streptomyces sp. NPDC020607]|uniref:DUF397 domain-containing protein n=1 Tax=Streptomyces sp. NPDC020607 TaxID=3365082 RepID=UPI00378EBABF
MTELTWQKSTYSQEASSCVNIVAAPDGTTHLRESDDPEVVLTTSPSQLSALIRAVKDASRERSL